MGGDVRFDSVHPRVATSGRRGRSWSATLRHCRRAAAASSRAKMVWRRAPRTRSAVALRPLWSSEITSWTPARPRSPSERRKSSRRVSASEAPTCMRSNSRWPFGLGGDGDDHRGRDDPPAGAYLDVGGVELEVGPGALERAGQERLDAGVDVLAEARDLTLRDAVHPHRLHQVVDRAGRGRPGHRPPG